MLHRARPWKTVQELKKLVRRDNPLRLRLHVRGKGYYEENIVVPAPRRSLTACFTRSAIAASASAR